MMLGAALTISAAAPFDKLAVRASTAPVSTPASMRCQATPCWDSPFISAQEVT